ncbi:hypothetical protein BH11BAC3_BH11BAC3_27170 [soil metagenome]
MDETTTPHYMKSLVDCHKKLMEDGFTESFRIEDKNLVDLGSGISYKPEEISIDNFFRFEGASDPEDNSILYAITTKDGKRGTLADAYGAYADADTNEFIKEVENIQKKIEKA